MKRACNENKRRVVLGEKNRGGTTRLVKVSVKVVKTIAPASAKVVTRRNDEPASYSSDQSRSRLFFRLMKEEQKNLLNTARAADLVILRSAISDGIENSCYFSSFLSIYIKFSLIIYFISYCDN